MSKPTLKLQDERLVLRSDYVNAKTGDLKAYGYPSLTEEEVSQQVEKILKGEELNIIGMFCKSDIDVEGTFKANENE